MRHSLSLWLWCSLPVHDTFIMDYLLRLPFIHNCFSEHLVHKKYEGSSHPCLSIWREKMSPLRFMWILVIDMVSLVCPVTPFLCLSRVPKMSFKLEIMPSCNSIQNGFSIISCQSWETLKLLSCLSGYKSRRIVGMINKTAWDRKYTT